CAVRLRDRHGLTIAEISPGGGLGVPYLAEQTPPDKDAYVAALGRTLGDGCQARNLSLPRLVIEPSRSIVARAGVAVCEVVASKPLSGSSAARYLHVDGGMADNIRPALYDARYTALLANRAVPEGPGPGLDDAEGVSPAEVVHVAGRYCESGDVLLR